MIAFFTEYYSGEIRIDESESEDAKWFDVRNFENLPRLPARISIARRLIDAAIGEMLAKYLGVSFVNCCGDLCKLDGLHVAANLYRCRGAARYFTDAAALRKLREDSINTAGSTIL